MERDKLDEAVTEAIKRCGSGPDRFVRLLEYLDHLKGVWNWSDSDLAKLKARVTRLMSWPEA